MILRGCFAVNSYFESNGKLYCASHPQSISIQKHGPDDRFNYSWNEFSLKIRNLNETCFRRVICSPPCRSLRPSAPPTTSSWAWPQLPSLSSGSRPGIWRLCRASLKIYFDLENISLNLQISPLLMPADIRISQLCKCESGNIFVMENICDAKYCQ